MIDLTNIQDVRVKSGGATNDIDTIKVRKNGRTEIVWQSRRVRDIVLTFKAGSGTVINPTGRADGWSDYLIDSFVDYISVLYVQERVSVQGGYHTYTYGITDTNEIKSSLITGKQFFEGEIVEFEFNTGYYDAYESTFYYLFEGVTNLVSAEFNKPVRVENENVYFLFERTFANCTSLKRCKLPSVIFKDKYNDEYGTYMSTFEGCTSLEEVEFGDLVKENTHIYTWYCCFKGCVNLKRIYMTHCSLYTTIMADLYIFESMLEGVTNKIDVYVSGYCPDVNDMFTWYNMVDYDDNTLNYQEYFGNNKFFSSNFHFKDGIRQGNNQFWNSDGTINSY